MTRETDATRTWLGLPDDADDTDVARTRADLEAFLATAPPELSGWARGQLDGPPAVPTASGTPGASSAAPLVTPRRRRSPLVPLGVAAAVAAGIVGVYYMGDTTDPNATPTAASSSAPASMDQAAAAAHGAAGVPMDSQTQPPLDQKLVDDLQAKIKADPKDVDSLRRLANEYSRAGHYRKASETQARIVELQPDNNDARLALGVAYFNMDDLASAEKQWNEVKKRDPKNPGVWYDLGFLYFAKNPPEMDKAQAAWTKLQEIAPDSEMAKSVAGHLDRFKSGAAAGTSPTDVPTTAKTNG